MRRRDKFPLLPRNKNSEKGRYGHALIVAGSRRMTGAAVLAAKAAVKAGSGLVTLAIPEGLGKVLPRVPAEVMRLELPATRSGALSLAASAPLLKFIKACHINAVLIGPGLSLEAASLVRRLLARMPVSGVLDADGLNAFQGKATLLKKRRMGLVLTPHRREFERLFGRRLPEGLRKRAALAKKISKSYDVVLALKGHRTLVVERDRIYVNATGNAGMAKGGTGDVLAGMIVAFIAQGLGLFEAARWAVYFHGRAGDIAVKTQGELSLTASDMIDCLPKAFGSVRP